MCMCSYKIHNCCCMLLICHIFEIWGRGAKPGERVIGDEEVNGTCHHKSPSTYGKCASEFCKSPELKESLSSIYCLICTPSLSALWKQNKSRVHALTKPHRVILGTLHHQPVGLQDIDDADVEQQLLSFSVPRWDPPHTASTRSEEQTQPGVKRCKQLKVD